MSGASEFARQHAERFEAELVELLKIPSVSTLAEHAGDVHRAADWIVANMQRMGLNDARKVEKPGTLPLVVGSYQGAGPDAPTVLVYCHYDVQPAALEDGWETDPFTPTIKGDRIYARGAVDSKCHVVAHLKAMESLLASGEGCPVNVKFIFEGEEESGSVHIYAFVPENAELLKADVCLVSDGSLPEETQPVLVYGLRGIVTMELRVTGPQRDLHSGHYGGNVHNPIQALAEIIAALHDAEGRVTVPGFYEDVRPIEAEEHAVLAKVNPFTEMEWKQVANAPQVWGEPGFLLSERMGARPTLEINGISGGFYGQGFKTVIPHRAVAKLSCRLVPDQDPEQIFNNLNAYIQQIAPPTVKAELVELEPGAPGILIDRDQAEMSAAIRAYELGWGKAPILIREGGSVPVVATFQQVLNVPVVLMPFGIKSGGAHGPNEYTNLSMFHKGVQSAMHFYREYAALKATGG